MISRRGGAGKKMSVRKRDGFRSAAKRRGKPQHSLPGVARHALSGGGRQEGMFGSPVIAKPRETVTLIYVDNTLTRNNAGSKYLLFRFRANGLYDPDPALGSGSISGFAEWRALYQKYLVTVVDFDFTVVNKESFPLNVVAGFSVFDPVVLVGNPTQLLDMSETPFSRVREVSAAGGQDRVRIFKRVNLGVMWGSLSEWCSSSSFAGYGNANPANIVYVYFGVASEANLVNGISYKLKVRFYSTFYSRENLVDRFAQKEEKSELVKRVGGMLDMSGLPDPEENVVVSQTLEKGYVVSELFVFDVVTNLFFRTVWARVNGEEKVSLIESLTPEQHERYMQFDFAQHKFIVPTPAQQRVRYYPPGSKEISS